MRSFVKVIVSLLFLLFFVLINRYISEAQVDSSISACHHHGNESAILKNETGTSSCSAYTCFSESCLVLMVTGIEFDKDSGLVRFIKSDLIGSGETFYFCNVDFLIFCGGQFCAVANGSGNFSPEMVQFLISIPPCETCDLVVSASPSEVWPKGAGKDDKTTATIMVSTTKPAPPEGCTVDLKVEPVENSGGHSHRGNRQKGTVTPATLTIPGGSSGAASAEYKASVVAGEEKIIAEIKGVKKGEATVNVKVPGLSSLVSKPNLLHWGGTAKHKLGDNNYGTAYTLSAAYYAVGKYVKDHALNTAPDVYLAVIDMSLPWGGLFDINGDWSTPHDWHRKGTSIDFSKYYKDSGGNNIQVVFYDEDGNVIETTDLINDDDLDGYFSDEKYSCSRQEKKIGKIHYECPK